MVYLLVWYGPDLIARHDVGPVTGPQRAIQLLQARDAARGRLLTLGAGLFAAGALIYTALNFRLSREGQVTDRYTKAIEQLGSDKLDVRIGGIYALERVARDSAKDHPTVMEVLAAFVREHSREQWPVPGSDDTPAPERTTRPDVQAALDWRAILHPPLPGSDDTLAPKRTTRPDVQAALTVIGRRDASHDRQSVDLSGADLTRANLRSANFRDAKFTYAHLHDAELRDADLRYADLSGADLSGVDFLGADLTRAQLLGADLTRARLSSARLGGAYLVGARLGGADLTIARLGGADLDAADLTGALLSGADLTGAQLTNARLTNARLGGARLLDARLSGADLGGATFDGAVPEGWVQNPATGRLERSKEQQKGQPSAGVDGAAP